MVKLTESQKDMFSFCKACTFISFLVIGLSVFIATQVGSPPPEEHHPEANKDDANGNT